LLPDPTRNHAVVEDDNALRTSGTRRSGRTLWTRRSGRTLRTL
jgi:hypothetical protein